MSETVASTPAAESATTEADRLVIWDFDGTVADTFASILACANAAAGRHLGGPCDEAVVRSSIGLPLRVMFERLLPAAGPDDVAELVLAYRRAFDQLAPGSVRAFPGIAALLESLSDRGLRHAVATSRSQSTLLVHLERMELVDRFDPLVCHDDVAHPKPHPAMVQLACERSGLDPDRAIVVGDTTFDIEMGNRCGATTCAVTWGNHDAGELASARPDHVAHDPTALEGVVLRWAGLE